MREINKKDKESYDFIDDAPPRVSPFTYGHAAYADPRGPLGGFEKRRAEMGGDEKKRSVWLIGSVSDRRQGVGETDHSGNLGHKNGHARSVSPESILGNSPESTRTLSQLLPEKPSSSYAPPRPPPKHTSMALPPEPPIRESMVEYFPPQGQQKRSRRVPPLKRMSPQRRREVEPPEPTGATLFEEDGSPRLSSAHLSAFPLPPVNAQLKPSTSFSRRPQYAKQYTRSPDPVQRERQPSLSIEIPRQASRIPQKVLPPRPPPPPVPAEAFLDDQRPTSTGSRAKSQASSATDGLLDYYASPIPNATLTTSPPLVNSPTPIEDEEQKRRPVPKAITVSKPTYPPRAVRESPSLGASKSSSLLGRSPPASRAASNPPRVKRTESVHSVASDTSFESTDPDEPTPPDENDKQLSPVHEAPSPIAAIRYPKVPRSSNQSVPRSPVPMLSPESARHPNLRSPVKDDRAVLPSNRRQGEVQRKKHSPHTPPEQQYNGDASALTGSTLGDFQGRKPSLDEQGVGLGLDKRLVIDTSHSRVNSKASLRSPQSAAKCEARDSPLKGYGRTTTISRKDTRRPAEPPGSGGHLYQEMNGPRPQLVQSKSDGIVSKEVALKSPLWEPKLTPRRQGDDLYLSVSAATPGNGQFPR